MTFLGKIFVMVNLVISLMMATVAMGLYSSSIDWTEKAAKGVEPPGLLAQRKAALKADLDAAPPVEKGWTDSSDVMTDHEEKRQTAQAFFNRELVHVRFGAKEGDPARDIDLMVNGLPKLDAKGLPVMIPAEDNRKKPLLAIAFFEGELKKKQAENATHLAMLEKQFAEDIRLTSLLTPPPGEKKGLHDKIVDERVKRLGILDEIELVQHLGTKAAVEAAVVGERIEMLDEQIKGPLRRTLSRLSGMDPAKAPR